MCGRKNKVLIGVIIVLMLTIVLLTLTLKPKKNLNIDNLNSNHNNQFAYYIQNADKTGYDKSENTEFPEGYKLNINESKCVDNNGSQVSPTNVLSTIGNNVTVTSNQTIYCTLYFDIVSGPIDFLREKDSNKSLTENLIGDMYRYQGTDNVNNWLCFGTTSNCDFTKDDNVKKYGYRIIGITEDGQLYLIKETFINDESYKEFAWNNKYDQKTGTETTDCNGECPEWNESMLFKRINGISNGSYHGSGESVMSRANTDIFVDNVDYNYLKSGDENSTSKPSIWYNLIEEHEWIYGDTRNIYYTGNTMYMIETGNKILERYEGVYPNININDKYKWAKKVNAKIGLQYIHDYLYAYLGGNPAKDTNAKNAWIHFRKDGFNTSSNFEWLMTRHGLNGVSQPAVLAWRLSYTGDVTSDVYDAPWGIRPTFYLTSNLSIKGGDGTKSSPFILDVTE